MPISKVQTTKQYDLDERTYRFAEACRDFVKQLSRTVANLEYGRQLIRSSGSQAANYIEASEALSRKDFFHRIRICRKEVKESSLWLRLADVGDQDKLDRKRETLLQESSELRRIFGSIVSKEDARRVTSDKKRDILQE